MRLHRNITGQLWRFESFRCLCIWAACVLPERFGALVATETPLGASLHDFAVRHGDYQGARHLAAILRKAG